MNLLNDVYYNDDYIALYLKDDKKLFNFEYRENDNFFINKTIKRPIKKIGNIEVNDKFFDLETAYGYGGFYTNCDDKLFLQNAMTEYVKKCQDEKIVAEFIRFHPFNEFPINNANFLDFNINDRDVVIKNLSGDILSSYTSKVRNSVKRADEKILFQKSENITKFIELYNATMLKNNAGDFYFFDEDYYRNLINLEDVKLYEIIFEDEIIAMGFFMLSGNIGHYHLSANTPLSYKLNSNYALLHNIFKISQELGIQYFMLGGGTTSNVDDPLLKFKKKFSKETKPFYISGKIYNEELYNKYNVLWKEQSSENVKYFLKYRLEIK